MTSGSQALVLAFDGLVADTLGLRAESALHALTAEGVNAELESIRLALPGRTLHETISVVLGDKDETLIDLAALRAQQEVSARMSQGVSLTPNARVFIDRQRTAGTRLVLRADSLRRDVERVLQLTDLEAAFTFVRCVDDLPRARGVSVLEGSYQVISQRLDAMRVGDRRAIECTAYAADVARRLLGEADAAQRLDVNA